MGLLRGFAVVLGAALALLMAPAIVAQQSAADDAPVVLPAKGTWQGQTGGTKLTIDPASNGLYVARAPQTPTDIVTGIVYVRGKHGRFRSKPPAGDGSIIDVISTDQIRFTRPDGSAEIFARIVAPPTVNGVPIDPVSGKPSPTPTDPVSGLAIPMLPGQFAVKTNSGCWLITDDASATVWARQYTFRGPCKYGVIDGMNQLSIVQNGKIESFWKKAALGDFDDASSLDSVAHAPRTSSHDLVENLSLYKRTLDDTDHTWGNIYDRNGSFATHLFLQYDAYSGRTHTQEYLHFNKVPCKGFRGARKMDQNGLFPEFAAKSSELARVVKFCDQAVARLRAEQPQADDFDHVDYGYYFETSMERTTELISADGGTSKPQAKTTTVRLCPTINSIVGCDAVWQGMLAPYISRFETLKPQEASMWARYRAERRARFAPLAAAWRAKIARLALR